MSARTWIRRPGFGIFLVIGVIASSLQGQSPNTQRGFTANSVYQHTDLDSVNLFNGNLVIRIPLGGEYRVGGRISYRFGLSYNVNSWDYEGREVALGDPECPEEGNTQNCKFAYTFPSLNQNAGMGWLFTLGRMIEPRLYQSPDGAEHKFHNTLHPCLQGDPLCSDEPGDTDSVNQTWMYTRDGSYLRLKVLASLGKREVHFPNGVIHTFRDSDGRLERIDDLHGNWVTVTYETIPNQGGSIWRIRDSLGRLHSAHFAWNVYYEEILARLVLEGFGGTVGVFDPTGPGGSPTPDSEFLFTQTDATIDRRCVTGAVWDSVAAPQYVSTKFLTSIRLPDGSEFVPGQYVLPSTGSCTNDASGAIGKLSLPTGGAAAWTWTGLTFPEGSGDSDFFRNVNGVTTRRLLDVNGSPLAQWTYAPALSFGLEYPHFINTVTNPDSSTATHYFSICTPNTSCTGGSTNEYGLPFTRRTMTDNMFLSTGPFLSSVVSRNGKQRSTFVRYEGDGPQTGSGISVCGTNYGPFRSILGGINQLVQRRVVYHDDQDRIAEEIFANFDGHGHYRTSALCGTFPDGNSRVSLTNFNPLRGNFGQAGYTQFPTGDHWILGTHAETSTTENGQTLRTDHCFDAQGLLKGRRVRKSTTSTDSTDLVSLYSYTANGNLSQEQWFGGFDGSAGSITNLCAATAGGTYVIQHTHQWGSLATSQYSGASFKHLDLIIDPSTGLAKVSKDSSGVSTTYAYDPSGRITSVSSTGGVTTNYTYRKRGEMPGSTQAGVQIDHAPIPGEILPQAEVIFDDLGRVFRERHRNFNGVWVTRETRWHPMGWKEQVSELEAGTPLKFTKFLSFDAFGRPGEIQTPDLKSTLFTYKGVREITREVKIGDANIPAITTERYDRQGRLREVQEPNNVITTYGYDAGNRLTSVNGPGAGQQRLFTYDLRGLLQSETHPENGVTNYVNYDARGHARGIRHPAANAFDLDFTFDAAERLTSVISLNPPPARLIKEFVHDGPSQVTIGAQNVTSLGLGKLWKGIRHNYQGSTNVKVTEELYYGDPAGRLTHKRTLIQQGPTTLQELTQQVAYDPLGNTKTVWYPQCHLIGCGVSSLPSVSNSYQYGALTAVSPFMNAIGYSANGMFSTIQHANAVTETQVPDASGMARPGQITVAVDTGTTLAAPSNLAATASTSSQVNLTWSASAGAASYQIERKAAGGGFTLLQSVTGTTFSDTAVGANLAYVYRVRAVAGSSFSPYSNMDLATTIIYANDPLAAGIVVAGWHFEQLRTAVNAIRATAGLSAAVWSSSSPLPSKVIKRADLVELRDRLHEARTALGLSSGAYTVDPSITVFVTTIKRQHVQELRERTR